MAMDTDYNPGRNVLSNPKGAICTHVSVWSPYSTSSLLHICSRLTFFAPNALVPNLLAPDTPCPAWLWNPSSGFDSL